MRDVLPEFLAVRLGSTVLLLYLGWINVVEKALFSVGLGDFYLFDSDGVQEIGYDLPGEVDGSGGIDSEHLVETTTIVGAHLGTGALDGRHGDLSHTHTSQIVDDRPVLHLSGKEHILDHLLMDIDRCKDTSFHVLEVHQRGVEDENRAEIAVTSARIEKSATLNKQNITMSFSAFSGRVGGR
jgi:hypothetical protein